MYTPKVLYEDNHLIIVDKPANMPCVPDGSRDTSTYDWVKHYIKETKNKPGNVFLGIFQRLDRPVSGVLAFAKTSKAANRLTQAIKARAIKKRYVALTYGYPKGVCGTYVLWMEKDRSKNRAVPTREGVGQKAITHWRIIRKIKGGYAVVLLEPTTGRPHQLRVTLGQMGCPIIGDVKYGAPAPLRDRSIALHSATISFTHPVRQTDLLICSLPGRPPFPEISEQEVISQWKSSPSQAE